MEAFAWIVAAVAIFGLCRAVDLLFHKLFRNKAEHLSGLAVRVSKRSGLFGVILSVLGIAAVVNGVGSDRVLLWGGAFVLLLGIAFIVYYLSFGIFYGEDSFLVSSLGKKSVSYPYRQIQSQKLYQITGGGVVVELHMENGKSVSVNSNMDGVYPFLDAAFSHWCRQKGIDPESCAFHDPSKSWWFPHETD